MLAQRLEALLRGGAHDGRCGEGDRTVGSMETIESGAGCGERTGVGPRLEVPRR